MGTERSVGPSWPPEIPLAGIELLALAAARQQPPPPNSPSPNLGWDEAFAPLPLRAGSLLTQLLCPVVSERGLIRRLGYLFLRRPQMTLSEIASLPARHAHVLRGPLVATCSESGADDRAEDRICYRHREGYARKIDFQFGPSQGLWPMPYCQDRRLN
jgi:hypothetical protein